MKSQTAHYFRGYSLAFFSLILMCFMQILANESAAMMSIWQANMNLANSAFQAIYVRYMLIFLVGLPIAGIVLDLFGLRFILPIAILVAVFSNYVYGHATTVPSLSHSLQLMGLANAFILIGVLKLGSQWLPKRLFPLFVGILFSLNVLTRLFSLTFISKWSEQFSIITVTNFVNIIGLVLFILLFVTLKYGNYLGEPRHALSTKALFSVLRHGRLWLTGVILGLAILFISIFAKLWGMSYLISVMHASIEKSLTLIDVAISGMVLGALVFGLLTTVFNRRRLFLVSGLLISAILFTVFLFIPKMSFPPMESLLFCVAFFMSSHIICLVRALDYSHPGAHATAFALVIFIAIILNAFLQPIPGIFINAAQLGHISQFAAWRWAIGIVPISLVIAAFLALFLTPAIGESRYEA